jgi:nitrogen-specific signal transduction histidine kinase
MLSLPGIKMLCKARDSSKHIREADISCLLKAESEDVLDPKDLLVRLAERLRIDVLVLIETNGKFASLTAAGRSGITCDLSLPSYEKGGVLVNLMLKAEPACGCQKLFTKDEVFPCEATWCDLIPMDSTVEFCFIPLGEPKARSDTLSQVHRPCDTVFVVGASDHGHRQSDSLTLKTFAAAAMMHAARCGLRASHLAQMVESLRDLMEREGYHVCCVDPKSTLTCHICGSDVRIDPASLRTLSRSGQGPFEIRPEGVPHVTAFAYPISCLEGEDRFLVVLKKAGGDSTSELSAQSSGVLNRFMSSIAHEIKNPLTGIAAGVQYLSRKLQPGTNEDDTVQFVLAEVNRLNRIVDDLYKIAKPPNLMPIETSINAVVEKSLLCMSEEILRKGLQVEQHLDEHIPRFQADSDRLQQVLINIIKNAIEVTPQRGKIRVETASTGREAAIRITDAGPGIAPEAAENLFEPFYSTKEGGTGLGLCISQRIVEQHGGTIAVETPKAGGATFIIRLPLEGQPWQECLS